MEETIGYPKPPPRVKKKDNMTFQQKYGTPLVPKKQYFLKRTPLKQPNKPIRQQSANKARQRNEVAKAIESKIENTVLVCQCCERSDYPLDPSHIVPQWFAPEFAAHPKILHWHCRYPCHSELCENQKYYQMADGMQIMNTLYLIGGKAKEWLRRGLNKEGWGEMNLNLFKQSTFYPEYLEEMENF